MPLSRRHVLAAAGALTLAACSKAADKPATAPAPATAAPPPETEAPPEPQAFLGDFNALGTEPFWALDVRAGQLHLQRPDAEGRNWVNAGPTVDGGTAIWTAEDLVVKITQEVCSDGMSDRIYSWSAEVTIKGETLKGCAMRPEHALAAL